MGGREGHVEEVICQNALTRVFLMQIAISDSFTMHEMCCLLRNIPKSAILGA